VPKKGLECLISAFRVVQRRRLGCVLTIIGDGPERPRMAGLVRSLCLHRSVELLGWQDWAVVADQMRRSVLLVVPSIVDSDGDRDGVPNVILEAFALGTVVVASRLEGIAEAVKDRETGFLVDPGDGEQLAQGILHLLSNEGDRRRLRDQARDFVAGHYDLRKNAGLLDSLLREAAA
jgi:glycosyltransferase involved in cell wall biosynthesis